MRVSIITSVYNCEQYIEEMIDSIISQSISDWEMIIIDDASTDSTWDIISTYSDERIIKLRNEENLGLTINLNRAWDLSKGEYLARIDGDDVAYRGRLKKQVEYMDTHPDTIILGGGMSITGDRQEIIEPILNPKKNKVDLLFDAVIGHPTMMVRRSVMDLNHIRYDESLRYAQDYDLEYRASNIGDISAISECVTKYRVHSEQVSQKRKMEQCKCANQTRLRALRDLGIVLRNSDISIWNAFCTNNYESIGDNDVVVKQICKDIVLKNRCLRIYDDSILEKTIDKKLKVLTKKTRESDERYSSKYHYMFQIQSIWISNLQNNRKICDWLGLEGVSKIAVYGMGIMGKRLVDEVMGNRKIEIIRLMDRNVVGEYRGEIIQNDCTSLPDVDAVIITVVSQFEMIRNYIREFYQGKIYSIDDIIHEVELI